MWADRFDGTLEDVFSLQDQVAVNVAGLIEPALEQAEIRRVFKRPTESMGSYDLYLRAVPLARTLKRAEVLKALDLLETAIAIDPDFGIALAIAATCHSQLSRNGWSEDPSDHIRRSRELADHALEVSGDDAAVLAYVANALSGFPGDQARAKAVIDRAIRSNSRSALAWYVSGRLNVRLGDSDAAIDDLEKAMRVDPISELYDRARMWIAVAKFEQRRFAEACELFREAVDPRPLNCAVLAAALAYLGYEKNAQEALTQFRALSSATIEEIAHNSFSRPEHRQLFLDGIALVDGTSTIDVADRQPTPERSA